MSCGRTAKQGSKLCRRCVHEAKTKAKIISKSDRKLLKSAKAFVAPTHDFIAGAFFNKRNPLRLHWMEGGRGRSLDLTISERQTCEQQACGVIVPTAIRAQMKQCLKDYAVAIEESRRLG